MLVTVDRGFSPLAVSPSGVMNFLHDLWYNRRQQFVSLNDTQDGFVLPYLKYNLYLHEMLASIIHS